MAAYPPTDEAPDAKPSRNIKEALSRLDRETELLIAEVRRHPLHETLADIVERMR
jgi:hypothetical protein